MKQASVRKDVECDFNLLKKRFNILVIPDRSYSQRTSRLLFSNLQTDLIEHV
jgi:hypothetical protein